MALNELEPPRPEQLNVKVVSWLMEVLVLPLAATGPILGEILHPESA